MLKIRIYHANEEECDALIRLLGENYRLLFVSSDYKDRNGEYRRRYLEIEKDKKLSRK